MTYQTQDEEKAKIGEILEKIVPLGTPAESRGRTMYEILCALTEEERKLLLPITWEIGRLYEVFQENKDEGVRKGIVELIERLEQEYRKRTRQIGKSGDWRTIEVFPGARCYYGERMGKNEPSICGHSHYFEDFVLIEYRNQAEEHRHWKHSRRGK